MPLSKSKKEDEIKALQQRFEESEIVVLTHYSGLTVLEMEDLRAKLRESGATFKVTKNTLAKIALKGTPYENIVDMFTGPTGVATSTDAVSAAKVANDYAKDNEKFVILGGAMGETVLDAKGIEQLAKLPSLDELRAKIVGLLQAPATQMARVLQAPAQQLVGVTQAYGETGSN